MPLTKLFIDFNSYFASIEQQENPKLRGKPVIVVPTDANTTCAIAASYEAKKLGIKTGTIVGEAKKLCSGLKIVLARHRTYIEYHHKLVETVHTCIPVDMVHSIDEMSCTLIGKQCQKENAIELAQHIKKTINQKVG
ncbi:MAG: DNA polymerase, partial [Bacteroidetes bacterium]|nr:DNA polymerase [Bacteroidota bacterium]